MLHIVESLLFITPGQFISAGKISVDVSVVLYMGGNCTCGQPLFVSSEIFTDMDKIILGRVFVDRAFVNLTVQHTLQSIDIVTSRTKIHAGTAIYF